MLRDMSFFSLIRKSLKDDLTEVSSYPMVSYRGNRLGRSWLDSVSLGR